MTEKEAKYWIDFLDAQLAFLGGQVALASADSPSVVDADAIAFLTVPDQSESAVEIFIRTDKWPDLKAAGLRSLYHRATVGKGLLLATLKGTQMPAKIVIPAASDRPQVIRWLFIDTWSVLGAGYVGDISQIFGHSSST